MTVGFTLLSRVNYSIDVPSPYFGTDYQQCRTEVVNDDDTK
jgi:hypothetical protein